MTEEKLAHPEIPGPGKNFVYFSFGSHSNTQPELVREVVAKEVNWVFSARPFGTKIYLAEQGGIRESLAKKFEQLSASNISVWKALARARLESEGKQPTGSALRDEIRSLHEELNSNPFNRAEMELADQLKHDYPNVRIGFTWLPDNLAGRAYTQMMGASRVIEESLRGTKTLQKVENFRHGMIAFTGSLFVRDVWLTRQLDEFLEKSDRQDTIFVRIGSYHTLPYQILQRSHPEAVFSRSFDEGRMVYPPQLQVARRLAMVSPPSIENIREKPETLVIPTPDLTPREWQNYYSQTKAFLLRETQRTQP